MQNGNGIYQVQTLALDQIIPWQDGQMRKNFDPVKLQELADSIKEKGVLQPILVRERGGFGDNSTFDEYELVAGERRWRAAKIAGLDAIPAIVRDLDDKAALEIQVIENLQRSDLSAIEEAEGYKRLLDAHGYTADTLAEKIGKSKSYVYARLKICNLPESALKALSAGVLSTSAAELIGRLPSMELREKLWEYLAEDWEENPDLCDLPTYRDIKHEIERRYMRELKGAPFDQADAKLLPEAGSCKKCPKRTGNDRANYPDGRADICTDTACFALKVEAANKRLLDNAAEEGVRVLSAKEAKQFFPYGSFLAWDKQKDFVDLADECYEALQGDDDDENTPAPTYAALLGDVKPEVVGVDSNGNLHRLVSKSAAAEMLRKQGIEIERPQRAGSSNGRVDPEYQKRREEEELRRKARGQALEEIAAKVGEWYDNHFANYRQDDNVLMQVLGKALLSCIGYPHVGATLNRRLVGHPTDKNGYSQLSQVAAKLVKGADAADIIGTLAEVCARYELSQWSHGGQDKPPATICEFAGLDYEEFEKRALKDAAAKKPQKAEPVEQ